MKEKTDNSSEFSSTKINRVIAKKINNLAPRSDKAREVYSTSEDEEEENSSSDHSLGANDQNEEDHQIQLDEVDHQIQLDEADHQINKATSL